jgi:hypothetical protein
MAAGSPVDLTPLPGTALKAKAPSNVFDILHEVGKLGFEAVVKRNRDMAEETWTGRPRFSGLGGVTDSTARAVGLWGDNKKGDKENIWNKCMEFMSSIETTGCELRVTGRELRANLLECAATGIDAWVEDKTTSGDEMTKSSARKQRDPIKKKAFDRMEKLSELLRQMAAEERENPKNPTKALAYWYYQFSNMKREDELPLFNLGGLAGGSEGGGPAGPLDPHYMPALPDTTDTGSGDEDTGDLTRLLPVVYEPDDSGGYPDEDPDSGSAAKKSKVSVSGYDTTAQSPWGQGLSWDGYFQGD